MIERVCVLAKVGWTLYVAVVWATSGRGGVGRGNSF